MLIMSNIGDQVWLMTSRQTDPELIISETNAFRDGGLVLHLVDVWVEYAVDKADAWTFVWVLVWQFYVDLPKAAFERCYTHYEPAVINASCV